MSGFEFHFGLPMIHRNYYHYYSIITSLLQLLLSQRTFICSNNLDKGRFLNDLKLEWKQARNQVKKVSHVTLSILQRYCPKLYNQLDGHLNINDKHHLLAQNGDYGEYLDSFTAPKELELKHFWFFCLQESTQSKMEYFFYSYSILFLNGIFK